MKNKYGIIELSIKLVAAQVGMGSTNLLDSEDTKNVINAFNSGKIIKLDIYSESNDVDTARVSYDGLIFPSDIIGRTHGNITKIALFNAIVSYTDDSVIDPAHGLLYVRNDGKVFFQVQA